MLRASTTYTRTKSCAIRHAPPVNTVGQQAVAPTRNYDGASRNSTSRHFLGERRQNKRINIWTPPGRTHGQPDMHLLYQRHMAVGNSSHQQESTKRWLKRPHIPSIICEKAMTQPKQCGKPLGDTQANEAVPSDMLHPSTPPDGQQVTAPT